MKDDEGSIMLSKNPLYNRLLRISSSEHFKSWHYHHAIPRNYCNNPLSELS